MERAAGASPQSRAHLDTDHPARSPPSCDQGARQYDEMVTAAAQLVSAANTGPISTSAMAGRRYRHELGQRDRPPAGWAQAYSELGHLRGASASDAVRAQLRRTPGGARTDRYRTRCLAASR